MSIPGNGHRKALHFHQPPRQVSFPGPFANREPVRIGNGLLGSGYH